VPWRRRSDEDTPGGAGRPPVPGRARLPRVIHALWFQGLEDAPPLVRHNLARWRHLNPGYRFRVLTRADVAPLLGRYGLPLDSMTPQALSNIVRARLLIEQGGVWVDASLLPLRPLDDWLPALVREGGFFAFERPGPDRPLSSWFLAATPDHPLLHAWWREIERYWARARTLVPGIPDDPAGSVAPDVAAASDTHPYFWFHYLFAHLLETDTRIGALWERCAKLSAEPPHRLQMLFGAVSQLPCLEKIRAAAAAAPVQKLNWRVDYPLDTLATLGEPGARSKLGWHARALLGAMRGA
jgi:hypothetical protein